MSKIRVELLILCIGIQIGAIAAYENTKHTPPLHRQNGTNDTHENERYHVLVWNFKNVETPFVIAAWILLASLAKIGFHLYNKLSSIFPESCMLIVLGVIIGVILFVSKTSPNTYTMDAHTFFLFLLPPIVLEAGYFMPNRAFFDNIGTILLFAVIGTLFNTFCIGASLFAFGEKGASLMNVNISFLHCLVFSSLISAVDPVAVLAVFEEIHVNEVLYIIVFGESLLNDAVTVVLYHMFETYSHIGEENIQVIDIFAGCLSFGLVGVGGTLIGVIYGLLTAFITRYTDHVRVIEPLFVFVMSYLSYLTAEMVHFSGIMSIVFCAISMKRYVEANISQKSHTTIKYFMKMMSSISETVIFMFLGLSTVTDTHDFNVGFVMFTLLFCLLFRALGVVILSAFANRFRLNKLNKVDQFVMSYGGLRGAIAFSLVMLLNEDTLPQKPIMVTTCIIVVYFTVFLQGISIKPLVNFLKVKKADKHKPSMNEQIHGRAMDHMMAGIEDITGHHGNHHLRDKWEHYDNKYLKRFLLRERPKTRETKIVKVYTNLNMKDAMEHIAKHGSFSVANGMSGMYNTEMSLAKLIRNYSTASLGEERHHHNDLNPQFSRSEHSESNINPAGPSEAHLTPNSTCIDMQAIEAHYCKKIADDSKIHHILNDNMFKPRKTWTKHKKHEVNDVHNHPPFHHKMRYHLRHMISEKQLKNSKRKGSKANLRNGNHDNSDKKPSKNVSFADEKAIPKVIKDENQFPTVAENSSESEDEYITFTAPTEPDFVDDAARMQNEKHEETPLMPPVSPTAAEKMLPWKRNTGRPPMSSSQSHIIPEEDDLPRMSECPSWVDNSTYHVVPSAPLGSATKSEPVILLNSIDEEKTKEEEQCSVPPLPWRRVDSDLAPVRSPSASHELDSMCPQSSTQSFILSEENLHAEGFARHSEKVNAHPAFMIDPPRNATSFPDNHDIFLEQSARNIPGIEEDDNVDTHNRIHQWLERSNSMEGDPDLENDQHNKVDWSAAAVPKPSFQLGDIDYDADSENDPFDESINKWGVNEEDNSNQKDDTNAGKATQLKDAEGKDGNDEDTDDEEDYVPQGLALKLLQRLGGDVNKADGKMICHDPAQDGQHQNDIEINLNSSNEAMQDSESTVSETKCDQFSEADGTINKADDSDNQAEDSEILADTNNIANYDQSIADDSGNLTDISKNKADNIADNLKASVKSDDSCDEKGDSSLADNIKDDANNISGADANLDMVEVVVDPACADSGKGGSFHAASTESLSEKSDLDLSLGNEKDQVTLDKIKVENGGDGISENKNKTSEMVIAMDDLTKRQNSIPEIFVNNDRPKDVINIATEESFV